jgi:hypothetical protein
MPDLASVTGLFLYDVKLIDSSDHRWQTSAVRKASRYRPEGETLVTFISHKEITDVSQS